MAKSQYLVTMSVTYRGVTRDCGIWDKKTGGDADSGVSKYRPGGMGDEEVTGGNPTVTDITVTRKKKRAGRNDVELIKFLHSVRGRATAVVKEQPLDEDANVFGPPNVYSGILQRVSGADVDSTSDDPDLYEVMIATNGNIG